MTSRAATCSDAAGSGDPRQARATSRAATCSCALVMGLSLLLPCRRSVGELPAQSPVDDPPINQPLVALEAWPKEIRLTHAFDEAQILLTGRLDSGEQVDVTRSATLQQSSPLVQLTDRRRALPVANGEGELLFAAGDQTVVIPVRVEGVGEPHEVSFVRDVAPTLSKLGCNAGTCHGSKEGKRGFKLSLRGYDYLFDHRALTDELGARRVNRVAPDQSLMLLKASGSIPHVGGQLTTPGQSRYEILRQWIHAGAPLDLDCPRVVKIELVPTNPVLAQVGSRQQMVVLATYQDGQVRDVTANAFIESGNIELLSVDPEGLVTTLRRGEAPVLARYEGAYTATTITVMGDRSGFVWQQPPVHNYVDQLVYQKLERVKVQPSDLCTDEEFIRRVYLDLTGLPPSPDTVRQFVADARDSRTKRDELIDRLVGSREYIEHWTNKWADLLQVNRKFLGAEGAARLRDWIKHSVATNKPYDQFAYEVLTASGSTMANPAAAYWKIHRDPAEAMENTTHLFLATRFNCNKCHDHPFERWTQDQYYQLAAYFAQVSRKEDTDYVGARIGGTAVEGAVPLVEVVFDSGSGDITHDRTGQVTPPQLPYDEQIEHSAPTRRQQLARWIVSPQNRYFATSLVNRLFGYLMGVGLIEPIDDIRAGNPPTNPELLDALSRDFIESGFDMQHMIRTIAKSRVYQHSIQTNRWNEDDQINYSHALPRRLPAEVLYDAIHFAAGSQPKLPGVPPELRAAQLPDAGITLPFLEDFGRPPRESACECERTSGIVLGPIMKLINGPTVADAVADPDNALARLIDQKSDDAGVVEELFLRFLARRPTDEELELGVSALAAAAAELPELERQLAQFDQQLADARREWEERTSHVPSWTVLPPLEATSQQGATLERLPDGSIRVQGKRDKDTYTLVCRTDLKPITGLWIEVLPDASLPAGGPGRADNGNFVLSELTVAIGSSPDAQQARPVKVESAAADFSQDGFDVQRAVDGNTETGWAIAPGFGQLHTAAFQLARAELSDSPSWLRIELAQQHADGTHALGRFRIAVTSADQPLDAFRVPPEIRSALATAPADRSDEQKSQLDRQFAQQHSDLFADRDHLVMRIGQAKHARLTGAQDLAWALINTPAFLFNR